MPRNGQSAAPSVTTRVNTGTDTAPKTSEDSSRRSTRRPRGTARPLAVWTSPRRHHGESGVCSEDGRTRWTSSRRTAAVRFGWDFAGFS